MADIIVLIASSVTIGCLPCLGYALWALHTVPKPGDPAFWSKMKEHERWFTVTRVILLGCASTIATIGIRLLF